MKLRAALLAVSALSCSLACDAADAEHKARDKAREVSDAARGKAAQVSGQARVRAGDAVGQAVDRGRELWAERKGELSDGAKGILAQGAAASGEGVEAALHKGEQIAPVALDICKTLSDTVDSDIDLEPIVQEVADEQAQAALDQRIADMPRVETIEGLDVGFKDVTQWDSGGRENQAAYLILWRKGDRLVGLVYRSRRRVNLDKIVAEAPRLIAAVQGVL